MTTRMTLHLHFPCNIHIYIYIYTVYIHIDITYIYIYLLYLFYSNFLGQTLEPYGSLLSFFFFDVEDCADFMVEPPNLDYVSNV